MKRSLGCIFQGVLVLAALWLILRIFGRSDMLEVLVAQILGQVKGLLGSFRAILNT